MSDLRSLTCANGLSAVISGAGVKASTETGLTAPLTRRGLELLELLHAENLTSRSGSDAKAWRCCPPLDRDQPHPSRPDKA